MAKGQKAKQEIINKILDIFEGSFLYNNDKEIRIPLMEDGELVQIKVGLTCAKVNVEQGSENALPQAEKPVTIDTTSEDFVPAQPTAEEKENVKNLLASLGL